MRDDERRAPPDVVYFIILGVLIVGVAALAYACPGLAR